MKNEYIVFEYKFSKKDPKITYEIDVDSSAIDVVEAFAGFMLAAGYAPSSIRTAMTTVTEESEILE